MSGPRAIAVVDVGYTNTKVMLFSPSLEILGERKMASRHRQGQHYREIDMEPMLAFIAAALSELDAVAPVDRIVTSAHGACIVSLKADGGLAVPIMDYMSDPPADIVAALPRSHRHLPKPIHHNCPWRCFTPCSSSGNRVCLPLLL